MTAIKFRLLSILHNNAKLRYLLNYLRRPLILCIPIFLFFFIPLCLALFRTTDHNVVEAARLLRQKMSHQTDIFIISAYYYNKSKSLGDNAVALVLSMGFEAVPRLKNLTMIGWSNDENAIGLAPLYEVTVEHRCKWITVFATAQLLPDMNKLALSVGNRYAEIPFKTPRSGSFPTVFCISPLFANEQWQYLLFAMHAYKRFGARMHLYLRSVVSPVYKLLELYEKEGYVVMEPWTRIHLTKGPKYFNPNANVGFRSQDAAQTDCLLQYKESAEFISFLDLDDILIPRLGSQYADEFNQLFNSRDIFFILYTKHNVEVTTPKDRSKFGLKSMISTIDFKLKNETGKMVTRPGNFNYTWIHWPTVIPPGKYRYDISPQLNSIVHLKTMKQKRTFRTPTKEGQDVVRYVPGMKDEPLIPTEVIEELELDFHRMLNQPDIREAYDNLPMIYIYFDAILKCFNNTFYSLFYSGHVEEIKCPGPERCQLPTAPFNCSNANTTYGSVRGSLFNVHFQYDTFFSTSDRCIQ